jgi:hypothetical protein
LLCDAASRSTDARSRRLMGLRHAKQCEGSYTVTHRHCEVAIKPDGWPSESLALSIRESGRGETRPRSIRISCICLPVELRTKVSVRHVS